MERNNSPVYRPRCYEGWQPPVSPGQSQARPRTVLTSFPQSPSYHCSRPTTTHAPLWTGDKQKHVWAHIAGCNNIITFRSTLSVLCVLPIWPFLEPSQPQLSRSPRLQLRVSVYMTPAALIACTKEVSLVATETDIKRINMYSNISQCQVIINSFLCIM